MGWEPSISGQATDKKIAKDNYLEGLNEQERNILRILQQEKRLGLDALSAKSALSVEALLPMMLELAMKKCIDILPGNQYEYCYKV